MTPFYTPMEDDKLRQLGVLNLAHVGDAVYELLVRSCIAQQGAVKLSEQHRGTIAYVAAPAQAAALESIAPVLTEEERHIVRRGRNTRVHGCPAGCTVAQYHMATALEALFGWLWLGGQTARVRELFDMILEGNHAA